MIGIKKALIAAAIFILTLGVVGCTNVSKEFEEASIIGTVSKVSTNTNNKNINILVEGKTDKQHIYDKASITLTDSTKIYEGDKKVKADSIKEGIEVEVVFEGPVRESYPVQADAKAVRIITK